MFIIDIIYDRHISFNIFIYRMSQKRSQEGTSVHKRTLFGGTPGIYKYIKILDSRKIIFDKLLDMILRNHWQNVPITNTDLEKKKKTLKQWTLTKMEITLRPRLEWKIWNLHEWGTRDNDKTYSNVKLKLSQYSRLASSKQFTQSQSKLLMQPDQNWFYTRYLTLFNVQT